MVSVLSQSLNDIPATDTNIIITGNSENLNPTIKNDELYDIQNIASAGAENNEVELAKKEWQEKGTESKYFKKWFGDSKVVEENVYADEVERDINVLSKNIEIKPVEIEKNSVSNFQTTKDLKNWIFDKLSLLGNVTIKDNGREVFLGKNGVSRSLKGANRNEIKRNSYSKLQELIENSVYYKNKDTDARHLNVKGQEIYHNAFIYNGKKYGIEISVDIPKAQTSSYNYAGHKISEIKVTPAATGDGSNELLSDNTGANISITDVRKLFNPNYLEENTPVELDEIDKG